MLIGPKEVRIATYTLGGLLGPAAWVLSGDNSGQGSRALYAFASGRQKIGLFTVDLDRKYK